MATSGSSNWSQTGTDIIAAAYRTILADEDFSPTANQTSNALQLLNGIIKSWSATLDIPVWTIETAYLLPKTDTSSWSLTADHVVSGVTLTALAADADATDTTITVDSDAGILDGDQIGIELEDGSVQWTTVSGSPSSDVVTLAVALTGDAVTDGAVWAYTASNKRLLTAPLHIYQAVLRTINTPGELEDNAHDLPLEVVSRTEYFEHPDKATEGDPIELTYTRLRASSSISIWPRFQHGSMCIVLRYGRVLEDFDAVGNDTDIPAEYNLPLVYELAIALAPTYEVEILKITKLEALRDRWLKQLADQDYEEGSIFLYPTGGIENVS